MGWAVLAPLLVVAASAGQAPVAAPQAGHYSARLCVGVADRPADCGPAQVQVLADGELQVRVDDIAYHLFFENGRPEGRLVGITLHGAMQVAEFSSAYRWRGPVLQFADAPRGLRYELALGARTLGGTPK